MGEHNKRRYKSSISSDNPFYTGMMVPATLKEKPPIELTKETSTVFNNNQSAYLNQNEREYNNLRDDGNQTDRTSGYRNKNLNSLVSSQIIQPTTTSSINNNAEHNNRAQ